MPKKTNAKKEEGQARKEATKNEKQAKVDKQKQDADDLDWQKGTKVDKSSKDAERKAEQARKKAEKDELMRQEEEEMAKISAKAKKVKEPPKSRINQTETKSYGASGLDDALELMSVTDNKTNEKLDRHPERRVKAALAAYTEKRIPELRKENPHLKLSQLNEILHKEWKKSPENPMNKVHVQYNTKSEDIAQVAQVERDERLKKFELK